MFDALRIVIKSKFGATTECRATFQAILLKRLGGSSVASDKTPSQFERYALKSDPVFCCLALNLVALSRLEACCGVIQ